MSIDTVCDFLSGLPVRAMVVFFEWVDRDTDMRRIFEIQRTHFQPAPRRSAACVCVRQIGLDRFE